jgi:tetratricopeptide (TPR) repeat protein
MSQEKRAEVERILADVGDDRLKSQMTKALNYIGDPPRRLIVTHGIAKAREGGYTELALKLARLAYEQDPDDPDFLLEMCNSLGQPQEIVHEINKFIERVDRDLVPQDKREKLVVALASGYKEIGRLIEGIQVLEQSGTRLAQGIELLAELYYESGEPRKTIDVVYERLRHTGKLSKDMAFWLAKSFDILGNYSQALDVLRVFRNDPMTRAVYEETQKKLGLVPDSDKVAEKVDTVSRGSIGGMIKEQFRREGKLSG